MPKRKGLSSSKGSNEASTETSGPRKRHEPGPPDFSDANSLVTFIVVDNEAESEGEGQVESVQDEGVSKKTETKFTVHKEAACYHSPILNTAFNSEFIEGQTQTYRLEDTTPCAFKFFVQWLYSEKLRILPLGDLDQEPNDVELFRTLTATLVRLWVLAEKFSVPMLQNAALSYIEQYSGKYDLIATECLAYVDENTAKDSLLRKYFIESISCQLAASAFERKAQCFPRDILLQVAVYHANNCKKMDLDLSDYLVPIDERAKDG